MSYVLQYICFVILSVSVFLFFNLFPVYKIIPDCRRGSFIHILFHRFSAALLFFLIAFIIVRLAGEQLSSLGLHIPGSRTFILSLLAGLVILIINFFASRTKENLAQYPQLRSGMWSYSMLIMSALSWVTYLFSYEVLLRGVLFSLAIPLFGLWLAVIINTLIYVIIHIPKGLREAAGAVPFGILICYITWETGNIWFAVITHIILALSNEWFSLYYQPGMFLKKSFT